MNNLTDKLNQLYLRRTAGIKFDLMPITAVLDLLDNPHKNLKIIHVAGTNGKGSVCAMIESVLRNTGLKTGLYTSPHLVTFNERFLINGEMIPDSKLPDLIRLIEKASDRYAERHDGRQLTFFEFVTAMAFVYFKSEEVDVAIMETGMGGRLDATNVASPIVSTITSISNEHSEFLGNSIREIAGEKAGIIKQDRPIVLGPVPEEAEAEINSVASSLGAPLLKASDFVSVIARKKTLHGQKIIVETQETGYGTINLPLHGKHQLQNCAVAIATLEVWNRLTGVDTDPVSLKKGLEEVHWLGRFQVLSEKPLTVLDGAHNPAGGAALAETISELLPDKPIGLIYGACADKDIDGFLTHFAGKVTRCWAVPIRNERSSATHDIAAKSGQLGWETIETSLEQALHDSRSWALATGSAIIICGSLFLCGEVLEILGQEA